MFFKPKKKTKYEKTKRERSIDLLLDCYSVGETIKYLDREVTIVYIDKLQLNPINFKFELKPQIQIQYWDNNGVLQNFTLDEGEIKLIRKIERESQ